MKIDVLDLNPIALKADGFDEAIVGTTMDGLLVYNYCECVQILMKEGEQEIDAIEHLEYNVVNSYVGEGTPIFIKKSE